MELTSFLLSSPFPRSKLAAVLVLLFEEAGELRVLLTTRSKDLRTHPGQTALPGGRVDEFDVTVIQTAVRLDCHHYSASH
jgi:8-oxo-dGTP pyrophosphatase MutT (NUDIX family)